MEYWGFYNFWPKNFKVMRDHWAKPQHTVFLQQNAQSWKLYLMHIKCLAHKNFLMNFMSHIYNLLNKLLVVFPTSSIAQWRFAKGQDPYQGCKISMYGSPGTVAYLEVPFHLIQNCFWRLQNSEIQRYGKGRCGSW